MKFNSTVSLILTLYLSSNAQPVVTRSHLLFPGDNFSVATSNSVPEPGPAGAGMLWDFSQVQSESTTEFSAENPNMTPYAAQFPNANIALVDGSGSYFYQNITDDKWEENGYIAGIAHAHFTDPRTYLELPLSYQTQWQDAYSYMIAYQINPPAVTIGEGVLDAQVEGYGTLVLPQAVFEDVLSIRIIGESTDTSDLGEGLYERNYFFDTTYLWLSPSHQVPLAMHFRGTIFRTTTIILSDTLVFPETLSSASFSFDPMAEPTSAVHDGIRNDITELVLFPNPFTEVLEITFYTERDQKMQLLLFDQHTRLLMQKSIVANTGENSIKLGLPDLETGIYLVQLQSEDEVLVMKAICINPSE